MAKTYSRLTRPAMRKLVHGTKINEHGIAFERMASGDGVFTVNIMVDGLRIHRVVGRESDGTTRTHAEEFVDKLRSDARHDRLSLPKGRKVGLRMAVAAANYVQLLEEQNGKDLTMKRKRLELHLIPFFGGMLLSKISDFDVERYKAHRRKEPVLIRPRGKIITREPSSLVMIKPATINRELAVLSHLLRTAVRAAWIDRVPCQIVRYPEGRGRITYLTIEQIERLLASAKLDANPQIYPFIAIGLHTAMRRGEILAIRREHVHLDRRMIYIPHAKAGAREQPITKHLADYLEGYVKALPPKTPWLFPSAGAKAGHTMDVRKPFRRVVQSAGLDPDQVLRHTLRHTAITHLVQAGVDLPTVKRISGHRTLAMVERYAHQNGAHIDVAMDTLQARFKHAS